MGVSTTRVSTDSPDWENTEEDTLINALLYFLSYYSVSDFFVVYYISLKSYFPLIKSFYFILPVSMGHISAYHIYHLFSLNKSSIIRKKVKVTFITMWLMCSQNLYEGLTWEVLLAWNLSDFAAFHSLTGLSQLWTFLSA